MITQLIGILLIGACACISLVEGFYCAHKAMKQNDTVLAVFAFVFHFCGVILLLCLSNAAA